MRSLAPPGTRQTIKITTTTATAFHRNSCVAVIILVVAQSTRATYFTKRTARILPTAMAILAFGSDFLYECLCLILAHLLNVGQVQRLQVLDYHCLSCRRALKLDHSTGKLKFLLRLSCLLFHIDQLISQSDNFLCLIVSLLTQSSDFSLKGLFLVSQLLIESIHLGSQVLHGLHNVVDLVVLF